MNLVIRRHRPLRRALLSVGLVAAVALALAVALDYGHWKSIAAGMVSTGEKRSLLEEAVSLSRDNESLRDDLVMLRRSEQINGHARKGNHAELVRLQTEIAVLRNEVEFYRDVVGAIELSAGPQVKGVRINPLEASGRYRYRLIMTNLNKDDRMAVGSLKVAVSGELNGINETLPFSKIVESGPKSLEFKFKHFHLFEGTFRAPSGFIPRQIEVVIKDGIRRNSAQARTYDWASVQD